MEVLVVEKDRLVRDQVKVGLQQFPEFHVTCVEGYGGMNTLRQKAFDAVFLGVPADQQEARRMIEHLRGIDRGVDLVVMVEAGMVKELAAEKPRHDIWSIMPTPLDVTDFFRLVARLRERRSQDANVGGLGADPRGGSGRYPRSALI
jgi:DNA-binding NtrC family response regulator